MHCETITVFQADFSEAEDVTEKKIVRHIFKVKPFSPSIHQTSKSKIFTFSTNMYFILDYSFPSNYTFRLIYLEMVSPLSIISQLCRDGGVEGLRRWSNKIHLTLVSSHIQPIHTQKLQFSPLEFYKHQYPFILLPIKYTCLVKAGKTGQCQETEEVGQQQRWSGAFTIFRKMVLPYLKPNSPFMTFIDSMTLHFTMLLETATLKWCSFY